MILRRNMTHLRKQEWTAIGIDFVIVVLGVFLGIQVSNWNEAAADRRAESAYLSQLQGDLQRIERQVSEQRDFEQFQARLAVRVGDIIADDRTAQRSLRIATGLTQLTMRRTLRTESPTFTDLQSSGNLEIISDAELRADVISYFFSARRLEAVIDKNNVYFVDEALLPFLRDHGFPARAWNDELMGMQSPQSGRSSGPFSDEIYAGRLFQAQGILGVPAPSSSSWAPVTTQLAWRAYVSEGNVATAQSLLDATQALEAKIARHLEAR